MTVNLDRYSEVTPSGWIFRFPNGWEPSVIREARDPFHFEVYLGTAADAVQFAVDNGGYPDCTIHHLTSEHAEQLVKVLASRHHRTADEINGVKVAR